MLFSILCPFLAAAQGPYWAKAFGGLGADRVADVKADAFGSLYFTGEYGAPFDALSWNGSADVLVGKQSATGNLLWMVGAGGGDVDRGLKLCPTPDNNVVVVGQFAGAVNLFGVNVSSQGGSQDVFVAKLSGTTGQALWVRTGGSDLFSDRPYGVTVAPNGNVTVAGDFKGTAAFDAQTITSMTDPILLEPSFDAFIASYSSAGDLLWLRQGAAPFTDRAIDVASDATNALYITGEFSDTITFVTPHPNTLLSATFLLKLDYQGNEQWFRRCGGASFSEVKDLSVATTGDLLLCGDLQGTMTYEDDQPHAIATSDPYACYLLRIASDGQFQADTVLGSDNLISAAALEQHGDSVALLGSFDCQFTGLSARYGSGLFMATGLEDLFLAKFDLQDLSFRNAQQFGGGLGKFAGQITSLANGGLVFCGGFEEAFILPSDNTTWPGAIPIGSANGGITYCGDANYGRFREITALALSDGFITRGVVPGRRPYDFWRRDAVDGCVTAPITPCVFHDTPSCVDELHFCTPFPLDPPAIDMGTMMSVVGVGPTSDISWNMGSTGYLQQVNGPGTYTCTIAPANSCWSWSDDAQVIYDAYPQPLVNDANGALTDAPVVPGGPLFLLLCNGSDELTLSGSSGGDAAEWMVGGVGVGSTITVNAPGAVPISVTGANNCSFQGVLNVQASNSVPLPNITGVDAVFHLPDGRPFDGSDTATVCSNSVTCIGGTIDLQWYIDGAPASLPAGLQVIAQTGCGPVDPPSSPVWLMVPGGPGDQPINVTIQISAGPCASDTLSFPLSSNIYFAYLDGPVFAPADPLIICPGDTLPIPLNCTGCDVADWTGPGIVGLSPTHDTAYVVEPGYFVVLAASTQGGAYCPGSTSFFVDPPTGPPLATDPPDGIVCPGAPAWIYTTMAGSNFDWLGPSGPIAVDNDSIQVSELGQYYLTMTSAQGCEVSNGPIALYAYGTPYLDIPSDEDVLCPGDSVVVNVVAPGATAVQWSAPLSGSDLTQVIHQPGTYTCSITSCGITTFAHVDLIDGSISAELADPGPYALCAGTSVTLHGPDGGSSYLWLPVQQAGQDLVVTGQGAYQLVISNDLGCTDTSAYIDVVQQSIAQPVQARDVAVCAGQDAILQATGSGTLTWFADAALTDAIGTGASITLPAVTVADTVYIQQQEGGCTGASIQVIVGLLAPPAGPVISGDTAVCVGDAWSLTVNAPGGSTVHWQTPQGPADEDPLSYPAAEAAQAGLYTVTIEAQGCLSDPSALLITVMPCDLVVPNIFSPNDDGRNDVIVLESPSAYPMEMDLFNRWGQKVFWMSARTITLDGRNGLTGEVLPTGVYYYELRIVRDNGEEDPRSGYIQLVR